MGWLDAERSNMMTGKYTFLKLAIITAAMLLFSGASSGSLAQAVPRYTLLVVFAHPDDEMSIGPLLARYASEGHTVHLVTVGSGEEGVTAHAGIPAGDGLGAVRREETRCAVRKLGIQELSLLGLKQLASQPTMTALQGHLREIIDRTKPDVVITWGPEGLTGHPGHIAVGNVVTRVFQQQRLLQHKPRKLYYVAYPESRFPAAESSNRQLATVTDAFVSTEVDGRGFLQQAREGMACHKTQLDDTGIRDQYELIAKTLDGRVFLRRVFPAGPDLETTLFAGL